MKSLKNLIKNSGRKIKGICKGLNNRFYLKDASIAFMTVSGPIALYLGLEDAFIPDYDYLNTASEIYGVGATSAVLAHCGNNCCRGHKKFCEIVEWAKKQNKD